MVFSNKVSVLIPTYNSAQFLDEAIISVLNQSYTDFELIIVDNNSTDNSEEVINKYLIDSRVKYYRNTKNIGMAGNWNKCLHYARGKYIKFLCADDKFHPQILEKFVSVLDNYPEVALVSSYRQPFSDSEEKGEHAVFRPEFSGLHDGEKIIKASLLTLNWIGEPSSVMFRQENLWIGSFNIELRWLIDWDMWLRQLTTGKFYLVPEILSFFRLHPGQGTNLINNNFINYFEEYFYLKNIKNLRPYPISVLDNQFNLKVKEKAALCGSIIPNLIKLGKYDLMRKGFALIIEEGVFLKTIFLVMKNYFKMMLKKFMKVWN